MLYSPTRNRGFKSADWFPRLTRERNRITAEVKRLAQNSDVASIVDLQRLTAILNDWPDREPPEYGLGSTSLALGASTGSGSGVLHRECDRVESPDDNSASRLWTGSWPLFMQASLREYDEAW